MPRRLSTTSRAIVYAFIAERDGDRCRDCGIGPPLEVHHLDGKSGNWSPSNLALLCKGCNVKDGNRRRRRRSKAVPSDRRERERERDSESPATHVSRAIIGHASAEAPVTMRAAAAYEGAWRAWLIEEIEAHGHVTANHAILAGAEAVGCSPKTIGGAYGYLAKITSATGPLQRVKDWTDQDVVTLRGQLPLAPQRRTP